MSIPDSSIFEGETYTYELEFGDHDGDEILLFVQTIGSSNAEIIDSTLFITPQNNFFGEILVTVTASDGEFDVNQSFTLTVIPINDPPVIMNLTDQTILEDSELNIELTASDPDGDDVYLVGALGKKNSIRAKLYYDLDRLDRFNDFGSTDFNRYELKCWIRWDDRFITPPGSYAGNVVQERKLSTIMTVFEI